MLFGAGFAVALATAQQRPQDLDAWFRKDARGQSCASCHSPDGIELRGFAESDIRRRVARHHQGADAEVIRLMLATPTKAGATPSLNIRPLQPAGKTLVGKTAQDRDNAFLKNICKKFPTLFLPVRNLADALAFQKEILRVDLNNLPIGIEMNRLSEDGAHGSEHQSIANWFPDVVTFDSDELRPVLEAYLSAPSDATLSEVDKKLLSITKARSPFATLSLAKYRSLMTYQHQLRTKQPALIWLPGNPFWQIADFARTYADSDPILVNVPTEIAQAKNMPATFKEQLKQLRLPWFWLGWIQDPSLTRTSPAKETVRAEYFCRSLEEDGQYIGHESFMLARKLAEQTRNPLYKGIPFEIQYSFFLTNSPLIEREPGDLQAKTIFRQLTANSFKMSLFLLEQDLTKTNQAIRKVPQVSQMKFIQQYLSDMKDPCNDLIARVQKRLLAAKGT